MPLIKGLFGMSLTQHIFISIPSDARRARKKSNTCVGRRRKKKTLWTFREEKRKKKRVLVCWWKQRRRSRRERRSNGSRSRNLNIKNDAVFIRCANASFVTSRGQFHPHAVKEIYGIHHAWNRSIYSGRCGAMRSLRREVATTFEKPQASDVRSRVGGRLSNVVIITHTSLMDINIHDRV